MGLLSQDLRLALRGFRRQPVFTSIALVTLALGIGANTAIFTVANALLLRQLPYTEPERLELISAERIGGDRQGELSWVRFSALAEQNKSFSGLAAFTTDDFNLTGRGAPEHLAAARVSWNFFEILGIRPAAGRWFVPEEDKPGGADVVVLSHEMWARQFGSQPGAVGQTLTLDGAAYTIVGVAPAGFHFESLPGLDLYTPRVFDLSLLTPAQLNAGAGFLDAIARLRPGSTQASAQAEMNTLAVQYLRDHQGLADADPAIRVRAANLRDEMVSSVRAAIWILFGAVTLVLLIACANVASLLLSRALGRNREIAVRMAMGASRGDIMRQLLTESLLLALIGGTGGALLSSWGVRALTALAGNMLPRATEVHPDAAVLAFTAAISIFAGIIFGLAPAWQLSRPDVNSVLRAEGRGATSGRRRNGLRNLLVVGQVALSMILLVGAGLLVRSFAGLSREPGFDPARVLTMNVSLPSTRYKRPQLAGFYRDLLAKVRALPGVQSAAGATALPANPSRFSVVLPEGQPAVPLAQRPIVDVLSITEGYAAAMRIPLIEGREFAERDNTATGQHALLVNKTFARRFWPNQSALGKRIWVGRDPQPWEVAGVLADVHNFALAADVRPEIDLPYALLPGLPLDLIVRTKGDPHAMTHPIEECVFSLDHEQPVTAIQTMDEILASGAAQPRFTASLLAALAVAALVLAIIGIYGAISYAVTERTREVGIRLALGADRGDILRLVLARGAVLAGAGIAIGIVGAVALTRLLATLLYHVSTTDPFIFVVGAASFLLVALAASYIPARRATRIDPVEILR